VFHGGGKAGYQPANVGFIAFGEGLGSGKRAAQGLSRTMFEKKIRKAHTIEGRKNQSKKRRALQGSLFLARCG
jgi:hypothetical protein